MHGGGGVSGRDVGAGVGLGLLSPNAAMQHAIEQTAHGRSTAASTVDADIMLSMTSAVARHCIALWDSRQPRAGARLQRGGYEYDATVTLYGYKKLTHVPTN